MSTETTKSEYLLLFRGTRWDKELSADETQRILGEWTAWFERLSREGRLKAGQPLRNEGRIVSGKKRIVADGPFAESKEAIGGYFLLQVHDLDEAIAIAKQCPGLDYGLTVEVRPVADMCPIMEKAGAQLEQASA